jgi:hypothetical protein
MRSNVLYKRKLDDLLKKHSHSLSSNSSFVNKNSSAMSAEDIAWEAINQTIPSECLDQALYSNCSRH